MRLVRNDSGRIHCGGYDAVAARFWKEMRTDSAWHSYYEARTCPEASAYGGVSLNLQFIMPEPSTYSRTIIIEKD